ncbi:uncharacterized protein LOC143232447 [Tachypleus tridentatus]|uniref:uncharacterized protein LOC143232447 n=1 Tax=Tachypleus tridentatus TaxID=6853 RepID=UPI003FD0F57F
MIYFLFSKGDIRHTFLNSWAVLLSSNENSDVYKKAKSAIEIVVWRGVLLFSQGLINATSQTPEAVRLLHVMMSDNHWNILSIEGKLAITLLKDEILRAISSSKFQLSPKQREENNKKSSTYDQSKMQVANSAFLSTSVSHRNLGTSFLKYFSPWMAETLLRAIDKEIDFQMMFYMQLTETKKIFDSVKFLTRGLCYYLKEGRYLDAKALSSKISLLVYKPVSFIKEDFYSAVFTHFISSDAKVGVLFSSTLLNQLATKTCADGLPCYTACIGISLYTIDFWTPQTGLVNSPERVHDIVEIHFFSSDSVTPIRLEKQKDAVTIIFGGHPLLPAVIQLSLGVNPMLTEFHSSTVHETDEYNGTTWRKECFMWEVDHWDNKNCVTNITIPGITICSCRSFGVVGVFKVNGSNYKSTVTPETESPNTFPPCITTISIIAITILVIHVPKLHNLRYFWVQVKTPFQNTKGISKAQRVSFKINGDYKLLVGDRKSEFLKKLKEQLAKLLNIAPSAIRNLDAQPGSVEVSFDLDPNQVDITSIMETITTMISNGEFPLKDLNNQVIEIEIDSLSFATPRPATLSPEVEKARESNAAIIAGVIGGVVVILIIIVIVIVVVRKKKARERVEPDMPVMNTLKPTYRAFTYAPTLPENKKKSTSVSSVDSGMSSVGSRNSSRGSYQSSLSYTSQIPSEDVIIGKSVAPPDLGPRIQMSSVPRLVAPSYRK